MKRISRITREVRHLRDKMTPYHYGLLAVLTLWGGYFTSIWLHLFRYDSNSDIVTGYPLVWADWAAHITYASVFAFRAPADWFIAHPLFADAKFSYPFLPDAISGLLMRLGLDVIPAFIVPSIFATIALLYMLYRFTYQFTGRVKSAVLALSLFFTSGGLGFLYAIGKSETSSEWYTHIPEHGIYFINFVVGEMIPQRNFLFGLPIALGIILLLERMVTKNAKTYHAAAAGLLAGSLTVIHPHSLIVIIIVSAVYALCYRHKYLLFLKYALVAATIVGIYWLVFLHESGSGSPPRWQWGWMSEGHNFILFELLNFGIIVPLGIYAAWSQKWLKHPIFLSAVVIFVSCHIVSLQAWEWDNTKLLTYSYLFLLLPIAKQLLWWWEHTARRYRKILVTICVLLLSTSGVIDINHMSDFDKHTNTLVSHDALQTVTHFRSISPSGAVILTSQRSDQPFTMLGNTQTLMAYEGWLWSYGIDYAQTKSDITKILSGSEGATELLSHYHVSYIVVDDSLRETYLVNDKFLSQFPIVLSSADTTIYSLR